MHERQWSCLSTVMSWSQRDRNGDATHDSLSAEFSNFGRIVRSKAYKADPSVGGHGKAVMYSIKKGAGCAPAAGREIESGREETAWRSTERGFHHNAVGFRGHTHYSSAGKRCTAQRSIDYKQNSCTETIETGKARA